MWRQKQDFLLIALRDNLLRARLGLLLDDPSKAMEEIDASLRLIDTANEIITSEAKFSVFNLKSMGARQNALILSDGDILRRALPILEKYAHVSLGRHKLLVVFHDQENWAIKQLFLELIAEKTNAECVSRRGAFDLNFRVAKQMSLLGDPSCD
ncbi:hypothetical protein FWH09_02790 [Candidatus Saccharibacteria bacterium]|nr:hypothetical protein [Candidatus Saccharibacteria bacterium]